LHGNGYYRNTYKHRGFKGLRVFGLGKKIKGVVKLDSVVTRVTRSEFDALRELTKPNGFTDKTISDEDVWNAIQTLHAKVRKAWLHKKQ